ncbi:glycosyltransferase family 4 protein [Hymenobacter oligotrophus]|uniref:Glycosyltransferase family 4 protein n=1 Tax=Hymenobacter oligotrophus TaxID=2319843 RepID=A0A3B7R8P0_9BACT|nr:glycosyltransferase [Hymenobacter oligotrophus]AYA37501.1 glycosyltransferase family 4 protein [Hymenobacter oligotrophus]
MTSSLPLLPRVLMLPKWYPNRYDDQDGDFVARHVAAIAPHTNAVVLFAGVARGPLPGLIECAAEWKAAVPTLRYYYRAAPTGWPVLDKPLKLLLYFACLWRGYQQVVRYWGTKPHLVHVHVLLRTGLFAWWLRVWQGIPYLVTEHWTLYLPPRSAGIGPMRRWLTRLVVKRAAALHTVSEGLRDAMRHLGFGNPRSAVIANVVDTDLFRPTANKPAPAPLLVVSAFHDAVKNISGILRVVAGLQSELPHLRLRIAGYGPDAQVLQNLAADLGLLASGTVQFLGKLPHPAVAHEMQHAAALISFSRAETFGCVLLEARACGCPVVATRVGGVPELFQPEGRFGVLIEPDDEAALGAAIRAVYQEHPQFAPEVLCADAAERCSPAKVGRQFAALYQSILAR